MSTPSTVQFEQTDTVKFLVDDVPYTITRDVLVKYPECTLSRLLAVTEQTSSDHLVSIKGRDKESAELFVYIYEFLRYGCLPRDFDGECLLLKEALPLLRKEAVFYNIRALIEEIDDEINGGVKRLKKRAKQQQQAKHLVPPDLYAIGGHSQLKEDTVYLSVYRHSAEGQGVYDNCGPLNRLNLEQILDNCSELTYVDQTYSYRSTPDNEKKALEIGATKLKIHEEQREVPQVIESILHCVTKRLFNDPLGAAAGGYRLVLQDSDSCPIVYSQGDIGTLLVCLPNLHRGGELTVRFEEQECCFDLAGQSGDPSLVQFVAVDKGCSYEFKKVTSGFQIILTYTIQQLSVEEQREEEEQRDGTVVTHKSGPKKVPKVEEPFKPITPEVVPPEEQEELVVPELPPGKGGCCVVM